MSANRQIKKLLKHNCQGHKKLKLLTLGCKVNQYETQAIREKFLNAGFEENNAEIADVCIINTCTVTAQADRESRRLIRRTIHINPKARIIVTGCYVEKDAQEILQISDRIQILPNQQKQYGISGYHGHERRRSKAFSKSGI